MTPPPLLLDGAAIDRVKTFKLLGVHVSDDLKWTNHIDAICAKAASRLHFLTLLAWSGPSLEDLVCFKTSVVRQILKYACPVWHSSLTVVQVDALESIQKRAMRLIYQAHYKTACISVGIDGLNSRREHSTLSFFNRNVLNTESGLHYLLPDKCGPDILNRLRKTKKYQ